MLVCGIKNRNRATHGDVVAVELLPRSEWQGRVTALAEGPGAESNSQTMATGQNHPPPPPTPPELQTTRTLTRLTLQAASWGSCSATGGITWSPSLPGTGLNPRVGAPSTSWPSPGIAVSRRFASAPSRRTRCRSAASPGTGGWEAAFSDGGCRLPQDHRVVVRIDSWESTSQYPNGHTVRVLGRAGELETEIQTVLIENCIHVSPFSEAQVGADS